MKYLLVLFIAASGGNALAIEKCQDASGKWHYGDVAAAECSNSKVITLNDRGTVTKQIDAPKTDNEIATEEQARTLAEASKNEQQAAEDERLRILSIYETEADIDRQRDNQLDSMQGNIDVHKAYLGSMDRRIAGYQEDLAKAKSEPARLQLQTQIDEAQQRIKESTNELVNLELNIEQIVDKFAKEKELYLRLKNGDDLAN